MDLYASGMGCPTFPAHNVQRMKTHAQHHSWLKGYCDTTDSEGDCDFGTKGVLHNVPTNDVWKLGWKSLAQLCLQLCSKCKRCRWISMSIDYKDCSWYHSCPKRFHNVPGFFTLRRTRVNVTRNEKSSIPWRTEPRAKTRQHRKALLIENTTWEWFQPSDEMRVAVLFHGKVGSLSSSASDVGLDAGDPLVVRIASRAFRLRVLAPNPSASVDLFVHAWNPSLGSLINASYRPIWSLFEAEPKGVSKVVAGGLSMLQTIRAKQRHEMKVGHYYDMVLVARLDLVWFRAVRWYNLPRAQLWLPGQCCPPDAGNIHSSKMQETFEKAHDKMRDACMVGGDGHGMISDLCTTSRFLRMGNGDQNMVQEAMLNYYVNDWFFMAPSKTVDTFTAIYEHHGAYSLALREVGVTTEWMHFFYAAHIHHALNIASGVRQGPEAGVEFNLVRLSSKGRSCFVNHTVELPHYLKLPIWGNMQAVLCPHRGRIACQWETPRCSMDARI